MLAAEQSVQRQVRIARSQPREIVRSLRRLHSTVRMLVSALP
ncbi:hypothetical protein [Microbacterium sp. SD291]|nr:hypothetical protein [Microbacterium sp. SD291]